MFCVNYFVLPFCQKGLFLNLIHSSNFSVSHNFSFSSGLGSWGVGLFFVTPTVHLFGFSFLSVALTVPSLCIAANPVGLSGL